MFYSETWFYLRLKTLLKLVQHDFDSADNYIPEVVISTIKSDNEVWLLAEYDIHDREPIFCQRVIQLTY